MHLVTEPIEGVNPENKNQKRENIWSTNSKFWH